MIITGDRQSAADGIAKQAGIDRVMAQALPADKAAEIARLKSNGERVAMVGDGINDAPALAAADLGIAMGSGTDIAIETAAVTLMRGDLKLAPESLRIARRAMRVIRQNLFWAFAYNVVGIPLAAGVIPGFELSPMFASAAMALSSVSVVTNALRLRRV